jgi:signal peptidase II
MIRLSKNQWLMFAAIDFLFTLDILLKYVSRHNETLRYTLNDQGAFSLPINQSLIILVSILIIIFFIVLFYRSFRSNDFIHSFFYVAIIFGAVSNVIDRIFYGGVIDYIFLLDALPAFNIADLLITLGIGGLILLQLKRPRYAQ